MFNPLERTISRRYILSDISLPSFTHIRQNSDKVVHKTISPFISFLLTFLDMNKNYCFSPSLDFTSCRLKNCFTKIILRGRRIFFFLKHKLSDSFIYFFWLNLSLLAIHSTKLYNFFVLLSALIKIIILYVFPSFLLM